MYFNGFHRVLCLRRYRYYHSNGPVGRGQLPKAGVILGSATWHWHRCTPLPQVYPRCEGWQSLHDGLLTVVIEIETGQQSRPSVNVKVLVPQLCLTLCDGVDCSPPGSSVPGILQSRILEWVALPFSRASFQPRDRTWVSCIAGGFFTVWARKGVLLFYYY